MHKIHSMNQKKLLLNIKQDFPASLVVFLVAGVDVGPQFRATVSSMSYGFADVFIEAAVGPTSGTSGTSGTGGGIATFQVPLIAPNTSVIDTTPQTGNNSIFYNYTAADCTNYVTGTLNVVFNKYDGIAITDTVLATIGSASGLSFSASIFNNVVYLSITTPSTDWNLNYSKIVFLDLCPPSCGDLLTEAGNFIETENGLLIQTTCETPPPQYEYLIAENGDYLLTEDDELLIVEINYMSTEANDYMMTQNSDYIIN